MKINTTRVKRNPRGPGLCPRCGRVRFLSRGALWPWSLVHCSGCDVSWFYGRLSLRRGRRDVTGRPSR